MPNTEPVVDSAAVLGSLIETAREEAEVPVGFLAAITKGQRGRGADRDGRARRRRRRRLLRRRPAGRRAGLMRRALQYHAITGRRVARPLRGADALPRAARCTRGRSRAELGFAGYPSVAESVMVGARPRARRRTRSSRSTCCTCRRASRSTSFGARRRAGVRGDRRGDAAPSRPDRRGGARRSTRT